MIVLVRRCGGVTCANVEDERRAAYKSCIRLSDLSDLVLSNFPSFIHPITERFNKVSINRKDPCLQSSENM